MHDTYESDLGDEPLVTVYKDMDVQHAPPVDEPAHKMRLSIDVSSIKDATFKGYIYAKYSANPTLGMLLHNL